MPDNNNGQNNKAAIQDNLQVSETPLLVLNTINEESPLVVQNQNQHVKSVQSELNTHNSKSSAESRVQHGIRLQQPAVTGNSADKLVQQNGANRIILFNQDSVDAQPPQNIDNGNTQIVFLDHAQQSIQNNELVLGSSNAHRDAAFATYPQQVYLQPSIQHAVKDIGLNQQGITNIQKTQQTVLSNEQILQDNLLNNQQFSDASSNSKVTAQGVVDNNGNTVFTKQGVPLIFLTQQQLNRGLVLLPQNFHAQHEINSKDNTQTQLFSEKSVEFQTKQNNINTDIRDVRLENLAPVALPLVYHNIPQSTNFVSTENVQTETQQFNQGSTQQTNVLQDYLAAQNLDSLLRSDGKNGESKQIPTAALYENGADLTAKQESQEDTNYSETYGEKISTTLINHSENVNNNPSKLIESTKNLITGLDVLSINGAEENRLITPLRLTSDFTQQGLISQFASGENFDNSNIISTTSSPLLIGNRGPSLSLLHNPIIVADLENENTSSLDNAYYNQRQKYENVFLSTQNTLEGSKSNVNAITESTVIVTPRPVHSNFLAPITAGIQLQNVEKNQQQKFLVEVQESVPYYVGKFEYVQSSKDQTNSDHQDILRDLHIGKTILNFPENQNSQTATSSNTEKRITSESNAVVNLDQQQEQGQIQQITLTSDQIKSGSKGAYNAYNAYTSTYHDESDELPQKLHQVVSVTSEAPKILQKIVPQAYTVEKIVEKPIQVPVEVTKYVDRPYAVHVPVAHPVPYPVEKIVEKYINRPYPVHVPVHVPVQVPVTVERKVPVPYPVEKIVEKPVTRIVEKPIPQPYPVEKIVEKKVPVEVTKYVDRPYPVKVPVAQPYPVEKIVEKIVNKPYPVPVHVPVPQPYPVEKIVEKQVPVQVNKYIDRPYPVEVPVAQPYSVDKVVNRVVNKAYQVPVIVPQPIPLQTVQQNVHQPPVVSQAYLLPLNLKHSHNNQQSNEAKYQHFFISNPYLYAPGYQAVQRQIDQNSIASNTKDQKIQYVYQAIQPAPLQHQNYNSHEQRHPSLVYGAPISYNSENCKTLNRNEYIGLVPPKNPYYSVNALRKRQAKSSFESPKMEYGFLPPLIPSQEIDEDGKPVEDTSS